MTKLFDFGPMYVMWLREMKRWVRAKSRIVSSLAMPFMFLAFLGLPMGSAFKGITFPGMSANMNYLDFLAPGIIGMTLLFVGAMSGLSVLWDKEFGFLKEVLVTPVNRLSIMIGRSLGGLTTAMIQAFIIVFIAALMGVHIANLGGFLVSIVFMILICVIFTGFGLVLATIIKDMEGFGGIMNLFIMPIFFLSGALFPLGSMPTWVKILMYINPLTYGVDALRASLVGMTPQMPIIVDLFVLLIVSTFLIGLGAHLFGKMEAG